MQSFDNNYYRPETSPGKNLTRPVMIAIACCFAVLLIGLIIASGFAIAGSVRKDARVDTPCSAEPVVWQDSACCRKECKKGWDPLPLLLISLDGFRYDYLSRNKTPSIKRLIDCGVHAPFMYPSYPTKTFPNHYSIVTGLYPESHGIIDNTMYDARVTPEKDRLFKMDLDSSKNPQWWQGEPFWNTVMKNGMRAATYFWPGSEVPIQGMKPNYTLAYDKSSLFFSRVDQVMAWLSLPEEKRPAFLTMYFDQPDTEGHLSGPDSPKISDTLLMVDAQINYLLTRLLDEGMLHCINIVIVADHGMQKVQELVTLDEYIPKSLAVFGGPIARISVNNSEVSAEDIRNNLTCKNSSYRVYLREDMPRRTHFMNNVRIGDVVVDGNAGVEIFESAPLFMKVGDHGYDNRVDTMRALFLAWGPSYKQNYTITPFQNIELYNFFADTLRLEKRAPNNGTLGTLDDIFVEPPQRKQGQESKPIPACVQKSKSCGTCSEMQPESCNKPLTDAHALLETTTNHPQCVGSLCDVSVFYDFDMQLPGAVFQVFDGKTQSSKPSTCTKLTYAEMNCDKVTSVESALKDTKLAMLPLNAVGNSSNEANFLSNSWEVKAPMYSGFYSGIWRYLDGVTQAYGQRYGQMMVISGPIFDYDSDGWMDEHPVAQRGSSKKHSVTEVLVPSHYFRILIRCSGGWAFPRCHGEPEPLAFVLPNIPEVDNCMEPRPYLRMHMARIRDIEMLTGFEFFQKGWYEEGQVHKVISLRTKITEDLW